VTRISREVVTKKVREGPPCVGDSRITSGLLPETTGDTLTAIVAKGSNQIKCVSIQVIRTSADAAKVKGKPNTVGRIKQAPGSIPQSHKPIATNQFEHLPCCHILTDLITMPRSSFSPHVGSHVELAFQKSRIGVSLPSDHGLPPIASLRRS
jgi:hypothetical protein